MLPVPGGYQEIFLLLSRIRPLRTLRSSSRISSATKAFAAAGVLAAAVVAITGCNHGHKADVLATVNGKPITKSQVDMLYEKAVGDQPQKPSKVQTEIVRLNILGQMIDQEILMQRAEKMHLVASDQDVNSQLNEIKAPFTDQQFQEKLKQNHLTLAALKHEIRQKLTTQKLFNKEINSKIDISDSEIADYYKSHISDFNVTQPEYHLAQILVTNIPGNPKQVGNLQNSKAMNETEARKKIQMLYSRLQNGDDFGTLATNFSENPNNSSSGGDMGLIPETTLKTDPEVYNAIKGLTPGEMTGILPVYETPQHKKQIGYEIFKLLDKESAGQQPLSDPRVQQAIRQHLQKGRAQLLQDAYMEMLRDQAHVQNFYADQIFKDGAK